MMNRRLQTRCLVTSAAVHGVLLSLLLFGPAFRKRDLDLLGAGPPLELVPGELIDSVLNPAAVAAPVEQPPPEPPREPAPVEPVPTPPPKAREPEPEPPPSRASNPVPPAEVEVPKATPRETPKIDFGKARRVSEPKPKAAPTSSVDPQRQRLRELSRSLERATASINRSSEPSTVDVRIRGGGGGSANALYVRNAYNLAWVSPSDVSDDLATTEVEVVLRRDGTVVKARIIRPSGIRSLDASVESALKKVTRVVPFDPFPDPDLDQVAFTIGFNLRAQRAF